MRRSRAARALSIAVLACTTALAAKAQKNPGNPGIPGGIPSNLPMSAPNPTLGPLGADPSVAEHTARIEREQEKARNNERQKKLVADTQKLLALATELKENVDKTNKDTMSVDVIRKADEIEKLAHSVKEKMKGS